MKAEGMRLAGLAALALIASGRISIAAEEAGDEIERMIAKCPNGEEVEAFTDENSSGEVWLKEFCWSRKQGKLCKPLRVPFYGAGVIPFTGVNVECTGPTASVMLSLSTSYLVAQELIFRVQNGKLKLLSSKKLKPDPHQPNIEKVEKLLKQKKFKEGIEAWILENDDPNCMSSGCRPSDDTVAQDLGRAIPLFAKNIFKGDPKSAANLHQAFFEHLKAVAVLDAATPEALAKKIPEKSAADYIGAANDWAYYLAEAKEYSQAKPILEAIVKIAPNRAVAHLNLADLLWATSQQKEAKEHYRAYAKQVKEAKWPAQLKERCPKACLAEVS